MSTDTMVSGRVEVIACLREARDRVQRGRAALLVHGPAGIGKSTVVQQAFGGAGCGVYGCGKGEQFGSTHPYRPLVDALAQALGCWLETAPAGALDRLQDRLRDFRAPLAALFPFLHFPPGPGGVTDDVEGNRGKVPYALRALVQALAEFASPVVLVLDDLQWVDDETLHRIELGLRDPEQKGLLGVFCCRDDAVSLRRGRELMGRLGEWGVATSEAQVQPLTVDEVGQVLSRHLGNMDGQLERLASRLSRSSKGSPLYVHHAVQYLASGGALEDDAEQDDAEGILSLLAQRLSAFSLPEREVLALTACAGCAVPGPLLVKAARSLFPELDVRHTLHKAAAAGLVRFEPGAPEAVRMSHDRVQEVCAGNPTGWPSRHLALWEAGLDDLDEIAQASDPTIFWLMDRQLEAVSFLRAHPSRLIAVDIALEASRRARWRAAGAVSLRACYLAQRLLKPEDPLNLRADVSVEHAAAAWLAADLDQFQILATEAERLATPLQLVPVIELRLQEAIAKGALGLALEIAREAVARLLPDVGVHSSQIGGLGQPSWAEATLEELCRLPSTTVPVIEAVGRILATAMAAAYVAATGQLPSLVASALGLVRHHGAPSTLPVTLAYWAALLANRPETVKQALKAVRLAQDLAANGCDEVVRARTADLACGMVLCWEGDFRQVVEPLQTNSRLAKRHGTYEYSGYSLLKSLTYRLFAGMDLASLAADVEVGRGQMAALGQRRIARYLERDAAVLRRLHYPGDDPCALSDETFQLDSLLAELRASGDRYGLLYTGVARLLLAVVFEQHPQARALASEAETYLDGGPGLLHQAMLPWLATLAVLGDSPRPEELPRARHALSRLELVAEHAPTVWSPRCALLRAELARVEGLAEAAETAYQDAEEKSEQANLTLDLYLIRLRRALAEPQRAAFWREFAAQALRQWRGGREEAVTALDGLEWATRVATANSEPALGTALTALLRNSLEAPTGVVTHRDGTTLASWNAHRDFAQAEILGILEGGRLWAPGANLMGVPILEHDKVVGAIVLANAHGFSRQSLAALENVAELTASVLARLSQSRSETAAAEREALYTTLIHESPAGFFARDRQGRLIFGNEAYGRAVGLPLHSLLGRTLVDSLPSTLAEEQQKECQSVVNEERTLESLVRMPQPDGGTRDYMVHRVPLRDPNGQVIGMCGVTTDITDLTRVQEQLERTRRLQALGDFAARIGHDLNNMTAVIAGHVELLQMEPDLAPSWQEDLGNISLAAARTRDLVGQLMMMGQSQSPQREPIDLALLIQECVRLARCRLERGATLGVELASLEGQVLGDPGLLRRILDNLLSNAVQALGEVGNTVNVSLSEHQQTSTGVSDLDEGCYAKLTVSDNGKGMDEQTLQKAFDPYFTTRREGTGLGLSIVHASVLSMEGQIELDSLPGQGTTVSLYFPLR